MALIDDIKREVQTIGQERELADDRAFGYWFLESYEDLSPEDAEGIVIDGPWDQGRDAVNDDEDDRSKTIYQFKYSEDLNYVARALTDVQRGLIAERDTLADKDTVNLRIITIATADTNLLNEKKRVERQVRHWLKSNGYLADATIELIDLKRFLELAERIYGVDLALNWQVKNVIDGRYLVGLADARGFVDYIDRDELFSFNIRKFLGLREGSVSWKIKGSLENPGKREKFWVLNNGIVCLCTAMTPSDSAVNFTNFTIVNGAQTIKTVSKFLEDNPTVDEPIWVLTKVLRVSEDDIRQAAEITASSNTQNPTSTRDIRATDIAHSRIQEWLQSEFDLAYIFKRGIGQAHENSVKMKDLAQAWISFSREEPHVSFARPGQIFKQDLYYNEVFPPDYIQDLSAHGGTAQIRAFLLQRLIPWKLSLSIRNYLKSHTGGTATPDKKYRSLTYHITWMYRKILEERLADSELVYQRLDEVLTTSIEPLFERILTYLEDKEDFNVPKTLKTKVGKEKLEPLLTVQRFLEIKRNTVGILNRPVS